MAQVRRTYRGREYDARTMLLMLGMGDAIATLVLPFVNFLPRTTDPDSAAVMMMVKAIQVNMQDLGCDLVPDSWLGPKTTRCLATVSGAGWYDKTWIQIIGDILDGKQNGFKIPMARVDSLGADDIVQPPAKKSANPLLAFGLIAAAGWIIYATR